ncbi:DUF488 domain-containing protein [Nocardia thailandica]|uniref:DUF488 domain-containing protein n=1 Tax=Nocardia thailandica TaxID=257275 RepID=A0ABW6PTI4_9NOCA|nr:DUF488 family protein [Nocardia thailandica]
MSHPPAPDIRIKRVYDEPEPSDGTRVLVDRLWPRGVSKERARIDEWAKDVTPSTELRHWFHADPGPRRAEFADRFRAELSAPAARAELDRLRALAAGGPLTLVTSVKDPERSHVPVIVSELREHGS